jgi:hypothetical protein
MAFASAALLAPFVSGHVDHLTLQLASATYAVLWRYRVLVEYLVSAGTTTLASVALANAATSRRLAPPPAPAAFSHTAAKRWEENRV